MAYSKAQQFADPADINHIIAGYSKAMSYPARVLIMRWLAAEGPKNAGEIAQYICLSKATTSQHLSRLERVGIIVGEEQGSHVVYRFNDGNFNVMREYIEELFDELKRAIEKK